MKIKIATLESVATGMHIAFLVAAALILAALGIVTTARARHAIG